MGVPEPEKAQRRTADLPPETVRPPQGWKHASVRFVSAGLCSSGSLSFPAPWALVPPPPQAAFPSTRCLVPALRLLVTFCWQGQVFRCCWCFLGPRFFSSISTAPHPSPPHPTCRGHWLPQGSHQAPLPCLAQPAAKARSLGRLSLRVPGPWHRRCQAAALPCGVFARHCFPRALLPLSRCQKEELLFASRAGILNLGTVGVLGERAALRTVDV